MLFEVHFFHSVAGGPYGGASIKNENEASGRPVGQNMHEDGYGVAQGQVT